jgi:hypothetical protein
MLHREDLVRSDVSEELSASIISVTRFGELETSSSVSFSETWVLRRATRCNIGGNAILHSRTKFLTEGLTSVSSKFNFHSVCRMFHVTLLLFFLQRLQIVLFVGKMLNYKINRAYCSVH